MQSPVFLKKKNRLNGHVFFFLFIRIRCFLKESYVAKCSGNSNRENCHHIELTLLFFGHFNFSKNKTQTAVTNMMKQRMLQTTKILKI